MKCFICNNDKFKDSVKGYIKCCYCGHEILKVDIEQGFIINDRLSLDEINKISLLDKFKINITKKCTVNKSFLLDIGSASGKFLVSVKNMFDNAAGVEITKECLEFSKECLSLNIFKNITEVKNNVSIATFWHSLEHIPVDNIDVILNNLKHNSYEDLRIIVSIPNNDSIQYKLLKEKYAYYDFPNHIHQFSAKSIDLLMKKYGFEKEKTFSSLIYSSFGYLQGFMNLFNKVHNYYYYSKKRNSNFYKSKISTFCANLYNMLLIILLILPSFIMCVLDLLFKDKRAVLTICYKKMKN